MSAEFIVKREDGNLELVIDFFTEELNEWEQKFMDYQRDNVKNGAIPIHDDDAHALSDFEHKSRITIREVYEIWKDEFSCPTAPHPQHYEVDE